MRVKEQKTREEPKNRYKSCKSVTAQDDSNIIRFQPKTILLALNPAIGERRYFLLKNHRKGRKNDRYHYLSIHFTSMPTM